MPGLYDIFEQAETHYYSDNDPIFYDMKRGVTNAPSCTKPEYKKELNMSLIEGFNEGIVDSCVRNLTKQIDADLKANLRLMLDNKYGLLGVDPAMNYDIPIPLYKYNYAALNFITKVIQQDLYTIIIDTSGKKYIVKAQGEKFDKEKGLMTCLLKYLIRPKRYSDIMQLYPDNPKLEKAAVKGALVSYIGQKNLDKFMEEYGQ